MSDGLNGSISLAAITYSGTIPATGSALTFGNNSATDGVMTLNGTGTTPNLILSNTTTNVTVLRINPSVLGSNVMSVALTNANGEVRVGTGNTIQIGSSVSGSGGIVKTGAGFLVIAGNAAYSGQTRVDAGTLRLTSTGLLNNTSSITLATGTTLNVSSVTGGFILGGSANQTLQGTGTVTGGVTVAGSGTIRGDSGAGTGTLIVSNVTIQSGGSLFANLGASGTNSTLAVAGNSLDFKTGSVLRLDDAAGFNAGTYNLATFTNGNTLLVNATATADGDILGEYLVGTGNINSRPVTIDVTGLTTLTAGDRLTLKRTGNNLSLVFTPVPEPASILAVCGLVVGGVAAVRRLRRKGNHLTPAA